MSDVIFVGCLNCVKSNDRNFMKNKQISCNLQSLIMHVLTKFLSNKNSYKTQEGCCSLSLSLLWYKMKTVMVVGLSIASLCKISLIFMTFLSRLLANLLEPSKSNTKYFFQQNRTLWEFLLCRSFPHSTKHTYINSFYASFFSIPYIISFDGIKYMPLFSLPQFAYLSSLSARHTSTEQVDFTVVNLFPFLGQLFSTLCRHTRK